MSDPLRARRHVRKWDSIVCGRPTCGGEIGKIFMGGREPFFSVPPPFVEHIDVQGVYFELPAKRLARERRGEEPLHHLSAPHELSFEHGKWRRTYDPSIADGRMAIWRGVPVPTRVRCPKCQWLNAVEEDVFTATVRELPQ